MSFLFFSFLREVDFIRWDNKDMTGWCIGGWNFGKSRLRIRIPAPILRDL
jgi:hypothetical protein